MRQVFPLAVALLIAGLCGAHAETKSKKRPVNPAPVTQSTPAPQPAPVRSNAAVDGNNGNSGSGSNAISNVGGGNVGAGS